MFISICVLLKHICFGRKNMCHFKINEILCLYQSVNYRKCAYLSRKIFECHLNVNELIS